MERSLGQVIRSRRVELGLTQQQLAERIGDGVEQSEVSRLERDQVALPRRPRMEQLARALEIPVGVLLARSGWTGAEAIGSSTGSPPSKVEELQTSIDQLRVNNQQLRESLFELLGEQGDGVRHVVDAETTATDEQVSPHLLRRVLNEVDDAAAVVDGQGSLILKNDAFSSMFAGEFVMVDADGEPLAEEVGPVSRAARRERFTVTFGLDRFGRRKWYWAEGKPMSTDEGELLGVVTIREIKDSY